MNLGALKEAIEAELRHSPTVGRWRRDVVRKVNQVHEDICKSKSWPWLNTTTKLKLWPAFEVATWTVIAGTGNDPDYLQFNPSLLPDHFEVDNGLLHTDLLGPFVVDDLLGGEVVIGSNTYIIEYATNSGSVVSLHLDPSFPSGTSASGTLTVQKTRHPLPPDCKDVLDARLVEDDMADEPLAPLSSRSHLALLNGKETSSEPCAYATDESFQAFVPPSERLVGQSYREQARNPPPRKALTLSSEPGTNKGLVSGTTYYYRAAWVYAGRVSPPGPVASLTYGGTGVVRVTTGRATSGNGYRTGRHLAVFRAENVDGPYTLVSSNALSTYDDDGERIEFLDNPHETRQRLDRLTCPGRYEYLRFWPLLSAGSEPREVAIRYRRRPAKLLADEDEPELPDHHSVIVYRACMEMGGRRSARLMTRMRELLRDPMRALEATMLPRNRFAQPQAGVVGASPQHSRPWLQAPLEPEEY